jgi:hypothetical protein
VFQRQDARTNHIRKRHTELRLPPVQRRHHTKQRSLEPQVYEDTLIAQHLHSPVGSSSNGSQAATSHRTVELSLDFNASIRVENSSLVAYQVARALKRQLTPIERSYIWIAFFKRWECITEQLYNDRYVIFVANPEKTMLKRNRSVAYPLYVQVLEDIRVAFQAVENIADSPQAADPTGYSNRASKRQHAGSHSNEHSKQVHATPTPSRGDRISKPAGHKRSATGASGKGVLVGTEDLDEDTKKVKKLDCPVYKHHRMYGTTSPCSGFCSSSMSQVRHHLNHGRGHKVFPECAKQCGNCKQEFVEHEAFEQHTSPITCMSTETCPGHYSILLTTLTRSKFHRRGATKTAGCLSPYSSNVKCCVDHRNLRALFYGSARM